MTLYSDIPSQKRPSNEGGDMPRRIMVIVLVLLFAGTNPLSAEQSARITGSVIDRETARALEAVNIEVLDSNQGTASRASGCYELMLPHGQYVLSFSMMGYQSSVHSVEVVAEDVLELNVSLIPTVYLMQGVTIIQPQASEEKEAVSSLTIETKQVTKMPGTLYDIYRAVKTLPGVTSNNGMSSEFNVRGGNAEENLVIVNGSQVYRPFHIKEAPNASIAIFNMDLLDKVDLITGGYSARYGDKMSSVMNIDYRKGRTDRVIGRIEGSTMHSGIVAEGPLPFGSWLLGVRKSHLGYILGLLGEDDAVHVDFYDIQGQLSMRLKPERILGFQFIHSGDDYSYDPEDYHDEVNDSYPDGELEVVEDRLDNERADYHNNLFALSFSNLINTKLHMKTIASYYDEREEEGDFYYADWFQNFHENASNRDYHWFSDYDRTETDKLAIRTSELKHDVTYTASRIHELMAGISYKYIDYDYRGFFEEKSVWGNNYEAYPETLTNVYEDSLYERISPSSFKVAGYVEDSWRLSSHLFANIGVRFDYFDFNEDADFSPRINLSYLTDFGPIIRAAWGYYHQSPDYKEIKYPEKTSENTKSQRATHAIVGIEYPLTEHVTIKAEAYDKEYSDLIAYKNQNGRLLYTRENDSRGYARGFDLFLSGRWDRLGGWFSYGYLVAKEDSIGSVRGYFPRSTDQRHTLSFTGELDIGKAWRVRLKVLYGSGFPYTPSQFVQTDTGEWERVYDENNSGRLPAYERIDLRLARDFEWGRLKFETYLEAINLFNKENVFAYEWEYSNSNWRRETVTLLPLIPNLGVSIGL